MIHDSKSIVIALAITASMLLMSLSLIVWAVEGMVAL
jgi:hypothetical protein